MMRHCLFVFLLISLSAKLLQAQVISTLTSQTTCPGYFSSQIDVQGFTSIASASLKISYDTSVIQYDSFTDLHPALSSGIFLINAVNQELILSWFSLNPATIGDGLLIRFHFHHALSENTLLQWQDDSLGNCVYTDLDGNILPATFHDGEVLTNLTAPQPLEPANGAAHQPENLLLRWNGSSCAPLYDLQYDTQPDFMNAVNINGIFGTSLPVNGLDFETQYFWRVKSLIPQTAFLSSWSPVFQFTTRQPDAIGELAPDSLFAARLEPNPAKEYTRLVLELARQSLISIKLYDSIGRHVLDFQKENLNRGKHEKSLSLLGLSPGLYQLQISGTMAGQSFSKSLQLLINK